MLEKTYDPAETEGRIYEMWERSGAFRAGTRPDAEPFCIVIPPPNVTGSLHMGHALNDTIQDILCRFERMRGKDVLWQPGMDHAGIATQMVVERQLESSGTTRRGIGRDAFVRRVWAWKEQSGGMILNQLKRLGASCDWSRERFTMDPGLSAAVNRVFVQLYKEGLAYKDKRLVNWDPKFLTAISDLEVQPVEVKGRLWHFRYPIEGEEGRFIVVATTRPETMLGDTGIAVHPQDERYRDLVGKHAILPLVGRRIPIVADEYADPETGSGAVKITPAHDFNDFEVGKRHSLPMINIFTPSATLKASRFDDFTFGHRGPDSEHPGAVQADEDGVVGPLVYTQIPEELRGLDRFDARKRIVARMEELGLLEKEEPHTHMVPHGDRSGVPIEPYLTEQWYVDAATLARPAIAAVEEGRTAFVPRNWEKTYFEWMRNIQPWCVSRQLWWGHQIPAWYGPDGEIFVEESEDLALAAAARHYGSRVMLRRDEDVLDTWFSSALWPFSTLGWPDETPELRRYYPTDVLVTGFDIIFFWVARMMMFGLHFMREAPFPTVYIHGIVRDEKGQKMSKSKGNVVDPLDLIAEYGADALRFTMAALATPGRDVKPSRSRIEGYRNFATKLWNAARFCQMSGALTDAGYDPIAARVPLNRWIAGEVARTRDTVTEAVEEHRYNDAAAAIYRFVWNVFCDWYLELVKPVLSGTDEAAKSETSRHVAWALDQALLLLHPFMPFVTEELWQKTATPVLPRASLLTLAPWPAYRGLGDADADAEIGWVIALVSDIRSVRSEMNVPAGSRIPAVLVGADSTTRRRAERWMPEITRLGRLSSLALAEEVPSGSAQIVSGEAIIALPLAGVIDLAAERARLGKELEKAAKDIAAIDGRLSNAGFLAKAPEEVVEEARERRSELEARKGKVSEALQRLSGIA